MFLNKYIPSFGRKHGRSLKPDKKKLLSEFLPKLLITAEEINAIDSKIHIEIGYGNGEHICHRAMQNPDIIFIGCEIYDHGIAACLKQIQANNIQNIRLFIDDARLLLDNLDDNSIDKIYLLFPDPWPKLKHHKRRIINQKMLNLLYRIIRPEGKFGLATDHHEYASWMLVHFSKFMKFKWLADSKIDWLTPPDGHIVTRYQQKNKAETDYPIFLNFIKD